VLSDDVVSHHPTPDLGSRCPWTPKHLMPMSVLPHLYTIPDLRHGLLSRNRAPVTQRDSGTGRVLDQVVVFTMLAAVCEPSKLVANMVSP